MKYLVQVRFLFFVLVHTFSHNNNQNQKPRAYILVLQRRRIGSRPKRSSRSAPRFRVFISGSPLNIQQDKDTGKYNQALAQAMDEISAQAAFIEVRGGRGPIWCAN